MFGIFPLQPAYGRDYKSKGALQQDWNANKDFITSEGRYANKQGFKDGETITIRYKQNRSVAVFKNQK